MVNTNKKVCGSGKNCPTNNKKVAIYTNIDPEVKAAFKRWWRANNYTTESEAVRALVRDKIEAQKGVEK